MIQADGKPSPDAGTRHGNATGGINDATQLPFEAAYAASQKVHWEIEDIIGGDKTLDFGKPFMPESLARVEELGFMTPAEKKAMNQIRGHGYLYLFGMVEEFILPFVLDHARSHMNEDDYRTRALLQFAGEEAKHVHLFKQFRAAFRWLRHHLRCHRSARGHRPLRHVSPSSGGGVAYPAHRMDDAAALC
jgi:hypothetical protein